MDVALKPDSLYMGGLSHLTKTQIAELADYLRACAMQADIGISDARGEVIFRQGLPDRGGLRAALATGRTAGPMG